MRAEVLDREARIFAKWLELCSYPSEAIRGKAISSEISKHTILRATTCRP